MYPNRSLGFALQALLRTSSSLSGTLCFFSCAKASSFLLLCLISGKPMDVVLRGWWDIFLNARTKDLGCKATAQLTGSWEAGSWSSCKICHVNLNSFAGCHSDSGWNSREGYCCHGNSGAQASTASKLIFPKIALAWAAQKPKQDGGW